jgi:putative hydrolase of the HAD superfamily
MIVFDFCGVLGEWPTPADRAGLELLAGRVGEEFWADYWHHRPPYDIGALTDEEYWARVAPGAADLVALVEADTAAWVRLRPEALTLMDELPGPKAILSNAPARLAHAIDTAPWAGRFAHRVFSADLGVAKPHARAYRALCERLGSAPDEIVFVDDRLENVVAAEAEGLRAVHFTDFAALRTVLR